MRNAIAQSMRRHAWNDVTAVAAINSEIGIGREQHGICKRLGHAHEAGVGEAHGHIGVLPHKLEDRLDVLCQLERNEHGTASKQRAQAGRTAHSNKVKSLGQGGLARAPWRSELWSLCRGPAVMSVAIAEQSNDESGVNEDVCCHSPSPAGTASFAR